MATDLSDASPDGVSGEESPRHRSIHRRDATAGLEYICAPGH